MKLLKLLTNCFLLSAIRALPVVAGFAPAETICLLTGSQQSKLKAILSMLLLITASNIVVSLVTGTSAFGSWCWFTYSAYILVVLLGRKLSKQYSFAKLATFVFVSSLIFWIWSNFGWWLTTPFYPKNMVGFYQCYFAALPFLRNSLLGNFCCSAVVYYFAARLSTLKIKGEAAKCEFAA